MTRAKVSLSEASITRISNGETLTIRVGELVELEVTKKATPEVHDSPKSTNELISSIFGKNGSVFDGLFNGLFGEKPPK